MAMPETVEKVRDALRIGHTDLDNEINDNIEECIADLKRSGVFLVDETEPLILNCIKEYTRSKQSADITTAEIYRTRYEQFKAGLSLSEGYGYTNE